MKTAILWACVALASTSGASWAQEPEAALSGEQILVRSAQAYGQLGAYSGTSAVISVAEIGDIRLVQNASAKIQFARPGRLRIEGRDTDARPYTIVSNGAQTWLSWPLVNKGAVEEQDSASTAIAKMTGVGGQAPTMIPATLMQSPIGWGFNPKFRLGATLIGRENVSGSECYKVEADARHSTWTFWVSTRDFLLHQAKEEQDGGQLAAAQEEMAKQMEAEAGRNPDTAQTLEMMRNLPRIASRMSLHVFAFDTLREPLRDDLFQKPAGAARLARR